MELPPSREKSSSIPRASSCPSALVQTSATRCSVGVLSDATLDGECERPASSGIGRRARMVLPVGVRGRIGARHHERWHHARRQPHLERVSGSNDERRGARRASGTVGTWSVSIGSSSSPVLRIDAIAQQSFPLRLPSPRPRFRGTRHEAPGASPVCRAGQQSRAVRRHEAEPRRRSGGAEAAGRSPGPLLPPSSSTNDCRPAVGRPIEFALPPKQGSAKVASVQWVVRRGGRFDWATEVPEFGWWRRAHSQSASPLGSRQRASSSVHSSTSAHSTRAAKLPVSSKPKEALAGERSRACPCILRRRGSRPDFGRTPKHWCRFGAVAGTAYVARTVVAGAGSAVSRVWSAGGARLPVTEAAGVAQMQSVCGAVGRIHRAHRSSSADGTVAKAASVADGGRWRRCWSSRPS